MKPLRYITFALIFPLFQHAQFSRVLISEDARTEELSIAINPANAKEIIAASRAGFYLSSDSGRTWKRDDPACIKVSAYRSPQVFWSQRGSCLSGLTGRDSTLVVIRTSGDRLVYNNCYNLNWESGKISEGLKSFGELSNGTLHTIWTQMDTRNSKNHNDSSFIFYTSLNHGKRAWSKPTRVSSYGGDCSNGDSTLMGATCCTGPDHQVYAAWAGNQGLVFRNLSDTIARSEKIITTIKNGWQYKVGKNASNGLPTIACDLSQGEHRGRLYVCWSDERHGPSNKNVFLSYSDDQGENWTEPIVVTYRPNHKEQFMPCMTIDQSNGTVYILYYDQQNFVDGDLADLYLAQSKNGGLKFDYYRVNATPIKPHPQQFYGRYFGLSAVNGVVRPIWAQSDKNNIPGIYTALIDEAALKTYNKNYSDDIEIQKTFTWSAKMKIDFTLKNNAEVSAVITKPLEAGFEKTVAKNKKMRKGRNSLVVDTTKLGLQKGNYTLTLYYKHNNTFVWIIEE
ncbi:MAG: sialidase family protein [Bacteroidota bacterium]